jgi:hypothetical protein
MSKDISDHNLTYYTGIYFEGLRKNMEKLVNIVIVSVGIRKGPRASSSKARADVWGAEVCTDILTSV